MSRILKSNDRVMEVDFKDSLDNKVIGRINLDHVSRLIALPNIDMILPATYSKDSVVLDEADTLRIDGQVYLGTVKSLASDGILDVYYITRDYDGIVEATGLTEVRSESFFLLIPSMLFYGAYGELPQSDVLDISGIVSGVDDLMVLNRGSDSSIMTLDKDSGSISSYLEDEEIVTTAVVLSTRLLGLNNLTTDWRVHATEINNLAEINLVTSFNSTQFIIIGKANAVLPTVDNFNISRINPVLYNQFKITNPVPHKNGGYTLAIPLNF